MVAVWFILSHGIYDPFPVISRIHAWKRAIGADMTSVLAAVGWLGNLDPTSKLKSGRDCDVKVLAIFDGGLVTRTML